MLFFHSVLHLRIYINGFHRLQKNGVIKTENPMRAMQQEGRFEELSDDDSS